ncbi:MAG: polysaccharide pyruvyl transferase family protein [Akkermansia sp.]|nr:polysaccharide pyruvyl transferase family protein [Akkermansia sp.]
MKKVYILTHPLTGNYGGMLQAYASYKTLEAMGFSPYIYKYESNDLSIDFSARMLYLKMYIKYILGRYGYVTSMWHNMWRKLSVAKQFTKGLRMHNAVTPATQDKNVRYWIGSDQVWRATFCRDMKSLAFFFLDFATLEQRRNSIAYAASMGTDEWEGTAEETATCKQLIMDLKAVSVREHSSADICRNILGREVCQMPDPTLLLNAPEYEKIIRKRFTWSPKKPWLSIYVLDDTPQINAILMRCAQVLRLEPQHLLSHSCAQKIRDRVLPTVSQWLHLVRNCDYFITDSFHGCVFAIIFNKPFVCLGNEKRGSARFDSLLGTFGLLDRMVTRLAPDIIIQILKTPIDWEKVNSIRRSEQERAFDFLRKNLN